MLLLDNNHPDIIESVQSDLPEIPQIKIRMVNADDEGDDDDADATITLDTEDNDSDEDDEDLPVKKRKLPKTKSEDIHSFL